MLYYVDVIYIIQVCIYGMLKLAAQGIFKDVQVKRNNENCVNISNVVFNQSNCEL